MMRCFVMLIAVLLLAACGSPPTASEQAVEPTAASTPVQPLLTTTVDIPATEAITPAPTEVLPTAVPTGVSGWQRLGSLRTPHPESPAAALNGVLYVAGGLQFRGGDGSMVHIGDLFEAYDPVTGSWTELASMPGFRHHTMLTAHQGRLYVFGGQNAEPGENPLPTDTAWSYDPASDEWSVLTPMPESRTAGAAVSLDDHIYVVGGEGGTTALLRYDPAVDRWDSLAPMSQSREHSQAVVLDGLIYALAGRTETRDLNHVEVYDPARDVWAPGPAMNDKRAGFGAAVVDGRIYVMGGELIRSGIDFSIVNTAEVLDPTVGRWEYIEEMTVGLHGIPVTTQDGVIYILGGSMAPGGVEPFARVITYTP